MKPKQRTTQYPEPKAAALLLKDAVAVADLGLAFPVRLAKAKLSALLELVASGQDVVITSDGEPKARLVGIQAGERGKVFAGMGDFLLSQPIHSGPTAEEVIRAERDGRP